MSETDTVTTGVYTAVSASEKTTSNTCCDTECITVSPKTLKLKVGQSKKLDVTVHPEDAKVIWSTTHPSLVRVNAMGKVQGLSVGMAGVYAEIDGTNESDMCKIKVHDQRIEPENQETNQNFNVTTPGRILSGSVDAYNGAHVQSNTLISLLGGQALSLVASYSSAILMKGSLGVGWHHNYEKHIEMYESSYHYGLDQRP